MQEAGVIKRYVAIIDGAKVDAGLTLFSRVWFKAQDAKTIDSFIDAIQDMPEIIECHLMAGECDAWLRIVTKDLDSYRHFHANKLTTIKAILSVKTDVPMDTVKLTHSLPI
nr:Lrp/AsnC family transcriptional regulator [Wohlfahrtiimonas chitiniclastica]